MQNIFLTILVGFLLMCPVYANGNFNGDQIRNHTVNADALELGDVDFGTREVKVEYQLYTPQLSDPMLVPTEGHVYYDANVTALKYYTGVSWEIVRGGTIEISGETNLGVDAPIGLQTVGATDEIFLRYNNTYFSLNGDTLEIANDAVITVKILNANVTLVKLATEVDNKFCDTSEVEVIIDAYSANSTEIVLRDGTNSLTAQWATGDTVEATGLTASQRIGIGITSPLSAIQLNKGFGLPGGISFGDGDTGIYENADDSIQITAGGVVYTINGSYAQFGSSGANSSIMIEIASDTNPTFVPERDDPDTGIGKAAADQLSLVSGAVEQLRLAQNDAADDVATFSGNVLITGTLEVSETAEVNNFISNGVAQLDGNVFSSDGTMEITSSAVVSTIEISSFLYLTGDDYFANPGAITEPNLAQVSGLTVGFDRFLIWYDGAIIVIPADTIAVTNNAVSFLSWPLVGNTLVIVSSPPELDSGLLIGHFSAQSNEVFDVSDSVIQDLILTQTTHAMMEVFPITIPPGGTDLLVTPDTDVTYAFDISLDSGEYYHGLQHLHELAAPILSRITPMKVWSHNAGGDWTPTLNINIPFNDYDTGTGTNSVTSNRWIKWVFKYASNEIHAIMPTGFYNTEAQALEADIPTAPPGLANSPTTTSLVIQEGSGALPAAGTIYWRDERSILTASQVSAVTNHTTLSGLTSDDHLQYLTEGRGKTLIDAYGVNSTEVFVVGGDTSGGNRVLGNDDAYDLAFETSAETRLFIGDDGAIGFGTITPSDRFQFWHDTGFDIEVETTASAAVGIKFTNPAGTAGILNMAGAFLRIDPPGNTKAMILYDDEMVFNEDGDTYEIRMESLTDPNAFVLDSVNSRIGIGTGAPSASLEVVGTVKAIAFDGDGSLLTGIAGGTTAGVEIIIDEYSYNSTEIFTKAEVDATIETYTYTKVVIDEKIKTTTEVESIIDSYSYNSTEIYTQAETYSQTEVDNLLIPLTTTSEVEAIIDSYSYNSTEIYTKIETDASIEAFTYSKVVIDEKIKTTTEVESIIDSYSYNSTEIYTKIETDASIEAFTYAKVVIDEKVKTTTEVEIIIDAYSYNSTEIYTKTEIDNRVLNDIFNVNVSAPLDGELLTWDNATSEWTSEAPLGTGDMLKSVYDKDNDGISDSAEVLWDGVNESSAADVRSHLDTDVILTAANVETVIDAYSYNSTEIFTKAETNATIEAYTYAKAVTYTQTEVDALLIPLTTTTEVEEIIDAYSYNSTEIYTQAETYSQTEVDNLLIPLTTTAEVEIIIDAYSYNSTEIFTKLEVDATIEAYTYAKVVIDEKVKTTTEVETIIDDYSYNSTEIYTMVETDASIEAFTYDKSEIDATIETYIDPADYINKDGTVSLAGDWTVSDGTYDMTGIGTLEATGLVIDSTLLVVDEGTNCVGIGTTTLDGKLSIKSVGNDTFPLYITGSNDNVLSTVFENAAGHGQWLLMDSTGANKVWLSTNTDSFFNGGKVGIGTENPSENLAVFTATGKALVSIDTDTSVPEDQQSYLSIDGGNNERGYIIKNGSNFATAARQSNFEIYTEGTTSEITFHTNSVTPDVVIAADGAVTMSSLGTADSANLQVNAGSGLLTYPTSSRLHKKNERTYTPDLSKFHLIKPKNFEYKSDGTTGTGFIAEDMIEVYPEFVWAKGDYPAGGVSYDKMVTLCVAKIQEQEQELINLRKAYVALIRLLERENLISIGNLTDSK